MKILGFIGSPRADGNTRTLVGALLDEVAKENLETKIYDLNKLSYSGCVSCYACKKKDNCVLADDITPILEEIKAADAIILGTPIYMWQMSGQLKLLVDRFFSYYRPGGVSPLPQGKKVLLAAAQENPDEERFIPYLKDTGEMLKMIGFGSYEVLTCQGKLAKNPAAPSKITRAARWMTEK